LEAYSILYYSSDVLPGIARVNAWSEKPPVLFKRTFDDRIFSAGPGRAEKIVLAIVAPRPVSLSAALGALGEPDQIA